MKRKNKSNYKLINCIFAHITLFIMVMCIFAFLSGMNYLISLTRTIAFVFICFSLFYLLYSKYDNSYLAGGEHAEWYKDQLRFCGLAWCTTFIDEIGPFLPEDLWYFVSPSANEAVFEKVMFDYAATSRTVTYVCSDLAQIESHEKTTLSDHSGFLYIEETNALQLASKLEMPANMIFDRKGALWHLKAKAQKELIVTYHNCLAPGGLLIVDSTPTFAILNIVRLFLYHLLNCYFDKNPILRTEKSTVQRIRRHQDFFSQYFVEISELSIPTKHRTNFRFKIYRKFSAGTIK